MRIRLRKLTVPICLAAGTVFCVAGLISGCEGGKTMRPFAVGTGGSADRGKSTIEAYGCGKCHAIPGIRDAHGVFGPPLAALSLRTYIAGNFPNTPDNLAHWVMDPQSMKPRTAMPDLGLNELQSRDVAAYLYTLR